MNIWAKEAKVIKGPKDILVLILGVTTLVVGFVFMPWSELGFNGNFPSWLNDLMQHLGIAKLVTANFNSLAQHQPLMDMIRSDHASDNMGDYAYALFLFLAISAASLAIILIGREENTEKTVLEAKK
jgi:hypothetical protein